MFLPFFCARLARPMIPRALIAAAALSAIAATTPTWAADALVAVSSGGFAEAFKTLAHDYAARPSALPVATQFGPSMGNTSQAIPARLARGESIDVVIMVGSALDQLIADGVVDSSTKVVLADSYIACAVPAGDPQPDLSTPEAVRTAFLNAPSVAWSDSASGEYIQHELLARLGIEAQVKAKGRQIPATPVGEIVAQRQAAFGCQQRSELQPVKGIDIAGELPEALQKITPYAAAVVKGSAHPEQARAFIQFLASRDSAKAVARSGLHPHQP
ncbi:substrate-binding domain-containing protein [Roseateles terrae]|uniref:Molybdate transport system substrate-binding protein n=1 Tax=Roseateles terrae TaxID=431060 RepID=A0ABR6GSX3_9BURK|nr:substrate-binding domain-containing protein [Roseateles terrae]MBB3195202.1 molybdate transport system substrate-binding protein [Roseateles terrae]